MRRMRRRNAISPTSFEAEILSLFALRSRNRQGGFTLINSGLIERPLQSKLKHLFQIECSFKPRAAPAA
jgi:hypothetical protein